MVDKIYPSREFSITEELSRNSSFIKVVQPHYGVTMTEAMLVMTSSRDRLMDHNDRGYASYDINVTMTDTMVVMTSTSL